MKNEKEGMEHWQNQIRDYRESGLTMRAWCAERGVSFNQLKYWLRKLSLRKREKAATTWLTVSPTPQPAPSASPLVLRVGGASIDIHPGFDPSLLGQVVRALEVRA